MDPIAFFLGRLFKNKNHYSYLMYTSITPNPLRVPTAILHKHTYDPHRPLSVKTGPEVRFVPFMDRNDPQLNIIAFHNAQMSHYKK